MQSLGQDSNSAKQRSKRYSPQNSPGHQIVVNWRHSYRHRSRNGRLLMMRTGCVQGHDYENHGEWKKGPRAIALFAVASYYTKAVVCVCDVLLVSAIAMVGRKVPTSIVPLRATFARTLLAFSAATSATRLPLLSHYSTNLSLLCVSNPTFLVVV